MVNVNKKKLNVTVLIIQYIGATWQNLGGAHAFLAPMENSNYQLSIYIENQLDSSTCRAIEHLFNRHL